MKHLLCNWFLLLLIAFVYGENNAYEYYWSNWGRNQHCVPKQVLNPKTLEEMRSLVCYANMQNIPIRFCGSSHSWSDLICTSGYIVNTDHFNRILAIDHERCTVRVEGGIKIYALIKRLAQENLALSNQGFITAQSIAGAIATATHGTGKWGSLSDFVIGIEIMDAQGKIQVFSDKNNPEKLSLARVHLGALGFIYAVTLQCEPLFVLEHARTLTTWQEALCSYEKLYKINDYYMFMGHPYLDQVLTFIWNRTKALPTKNNRLKFFEHLLFGPLGNALATRSTRAAPTITNKYLHTLFFTVLEQMPHCDYSYKLLSPYTHPLEIERDYIESEIAVPIDFFQEAVKQVRALFKSYQEQDKLLVGMITCRFCPAQPASCLNPVYKRDSAYIAVTLVNYFKEYEQFFRDFYNVMKKYEGRPHWGKFNCLTKEELYSLYGENIAKFNQLRKQFDPQGIFANEYIKYCFD